MALELAVCGAIGDVDRAQWDALTGGVPMLKHGYLSAMEGVRLADVRRRYFLWRSSAGEVLAHSWCFSLTASPEGLLPQGHWAARVSREMPGRLRQVGLRIVVCGSATTVGHTLCFSPRLDAMQMRLCLEQLSNALQIFAVEERARIVLLRDFHQHYDALTMALPDLGFVRISNLDDTVIPLRWTSFDDYLSTLKSHYRKQIERHDDALLRAGVTRRRTRNWGEYAPRMAVLFANVARRYPGGGLIGADYFSATSGCLEGELETTLFFQDGELVAFIMYFIGETALFASYVGVDDRLNREAALTFNAYNEVVRVAIERGVDHLWFGRTAYDAKLRMGAERRALDLFLQTRPRFIGRWISRWAQGRRKPRGPDRWEVFRRKALTSPAEA